MGCYYCWNEIKNILRKEKNKDPLIDDLSYDEGKQAMDMLDKLHNYSNENEIDYILMFERILPLLTQRQQEILKFERDQYTNFVIALKLRISEQTVKNEKKKYKEKIRKIYPNLKSIIRNT